MMKKLFQHHQIQGAVKFWANPQPVAFASFYFYDRGKSALQKSYEGLLRALLYQITNQFPELIPLISAFLISQTERSSSGAPYTWTIENLCKAFETIKDQPGRSEKIRICMFLDGLDEYKSLDEIEHEKLCARTSATTEEVPYRMRRRSLENIRELVLQLASSDHIKLCISSRPETAFGPKFGTMPCLKLEELTESDIHTFVSSNSEASEYWTSTLRDPDQRSHLIRMIVLKSKGVFLCVEVVVRNILWGLEDGSRRSDLLQFVTSLPEELFGLYGEMLRKANPSLLIQGAKIFQLFLARKGDLTALTLHFAETATTAEVLSSRYGDNPIITRERAPEIM